MTTPPKKQYPYEVASEGSSRAFIAIIAGNATVYLPWHAMKRMKHDEARALLIMEFANESVEMSGDGLESVAELAASARLKLIRQGETDEVRINSIRLVTDND